MKRPVYVLIFPGVEILDITGPVQALHQANSFGARYELRYCGPTATAGTAQGLALAGLQPLGVVEPESWVLVPGFTMEGAPPPPECASWLRQAADNGATVISVCTGAFLLGAAGLLDRRSCTTHWNRIPELRAKHPSARVLDDRLFVQDGRVITSAGIAAGIDMAISLIGDDLGPHIASDVARDMVVYLRRDGSAPQESVYLRYQDHLHAGIHRVQQHLMANPAARDTLTELASIAYMSGRNLTRTFRRVTGISIGDYRDQLRLERARSLMSASSMKLESIARQCGFRDARQLRRLWKKHHGTSPRSARD